MEDSRSSTNGFRLGRLRFIRLPPISVSFPSERSKLESLPFDIGVGVTDDYGTDIDMFESLDLRLEVVDETPKSSIGLLLASDDRSKSGSVANSLDFAFTPARGPFHGLSLKLCISSARDQLPSSVHFRLSVVPSAESAPSASLEDEASRRIRTIINESAQDVLETWDEQRYLFLSVESGSVGLTRRPTPGHSASKVQTTLRKIRIATPSETSSTAITIVERPGLNNSTGQRLWDCAIGLSAFISLHSHSLDSREPLLSPGCSDEPHRSKRRKLSSKGTESNLVIELGSGCALASMAAATLDLGPPRRVIATDIDATVETTLRENLEYNQSVVDKAILDWGNLSDERVQEIVGPGSSAHVTLIATDVLYNPESHSLLLETLLTFLRPSASVRKHIASARALIAYKRRTDGDDRFFDLSRNEGLQVRKIWEWSEVSVWSFEGELVQ